MLPTAQELSNLIGLLYDAADNPSLWAPFIETLARRTKSTSGALLIQDYNHATYSLSSSWQMPHDSVRSYQQHYHNVDVWAEVALPKPSGYVCTSQSLCPLPTMKTKEFYNDFMVSAGIEHGMFALVENNQSCLASVCLYRNRSGTEFSNSEAQVLKFLAPHLQRAFKLHLHFSELKAHSAGVEEALNTLSIGVILIGPGGTLILMNRTAAALVGEKDGLLATSHGLRAERPEESSRLAKAISNAELTSNANGISVPGTVMISRRARPPLQVLVSAAPLCIFQSLSRIVAIVFVQDSSRSKHHSESAIRDRYGLTPAESRVAVLLADGHSPREISAMLVVTDHTIRSQIKSIFAKTGVRRQAELVALILTSKPPQL